MAAEALTGVESKHLKGVALKLRDVVQATQYDWVQFDGKGIRLLAARLKTGGGATVAWNTLTVNNTGTAYTATSSTIAYDGGSATITRPDKSFYVLSDAGEILEVIDSDPDGTTGNLTVLKRGALGTTATADGIANNDILYVLTTLVLGDSQTGPVELTYFDLESDPNLDYFG